MTRIPTLLRYIEIILSILLSLIWARIMMMILTIYGMQEKSVSGLGCV